MVDARTIEKYEQEAIEKNRSSWFLAYILDTNEEERAKGKTVEVGRAHFATEKKRYTILDAPGHKNYVPNMIQGVAQADIGVLVISSRKGEFESGFDKNGQTREHAILAKTLGIRKLIVAINKMDDSTVNWEKERYDEIVTKLAPFIKGIGYAPKDVIWVPISGYTGINVSKPLDPKLCPFYQGPTLLGLLDEMSPLERLDESPLRIPVLDKYKESGKVFVLGKVEAGVLRTGDDILIMPGNVKVNVSQIQNDENIITVARPGENVKVVLKITQLEEDAIAKGCVLQLAKDPLMPVTDELVGQIAVMELLEHKSLLSPGYECVCHLHTSTVEINVVKLLDELDPKTGESKKKLPKFVQSKSAVIAHFKLARPVPLEKFADYAQLGRFTLRDEGKTIAFGKILATNAPVRKLKQ
jgi:peptide chain release factor subunit 3